MMRAFFSIVLIFCFVLSLCSCEEGSIYFSKHYYLFKANVDGDIVYLVMTNKREELTYPYEQEILEINTSGDTVYWRSVENIYHILDTKTGNCQHTEIPPDIKLLPVEVYWKRYYK